MVLFGFIDYKTKHYDSDEVKEARKRIKRMFRWKKGKRTFKDFKMGVVILIVIQKVIS